MVADGERLTGCQARDARSGRGRLAAVAVVLALLLLPSPAMAADGVDITVVVGFADTFEPGRWTPLSVTVTNHGGDLSGELDVQVAGGDELRGRLFSVSHRRRLELRRDSRKTLQFTAFLQGLSHPLVIRVRSQGREVARAQVDLRTRFAAGRLLLALSRDADLDYLNERAADGLRVLYPHPELLPVHWRGYDAVAAVVVHGVSLERLSGSQFDALHKWIAQGGIVAVSGGPDYALLRSPRLAALLPGLPVGMTRIAADVLQAAFSASLDIARPVHVNRLGEFRGRVRLRAGAAPLIVERALGRGRVLYLTFDVAGYPFDRWDGMRALLLDTLRLPPPAAASASAAERNPESALAALVRTESTNFPPHSAVFLFLTLYLGLLLAGYRFPVLGTRLRWPLALWNWTAPVVFALGAWLLYGPAAFPRDPTAVAMALIEPLPGSGYARLALDLGVYASRSGVLRLEYQGAEPVLYPPRSAQRQGTAADWVFGEGPRRFLEPRDRRRYVLHALQGEDVIAFHLEASVRTEPAGLRIVLDNASGRALEALSLVFDGYAYRLGSIGEGARVERVLARGTHGVALAGSPWWHALKPPPGAAAKDPAPTRIALERWAQQADGSGILRPGDALLIGYTESPLRPAGASAGWPRLERALIAQRIEVVPGNATQARPEAPDVRGFGAAPSVREEE